MHVALADAQSHEFVHHFVVHLMMESVAIARNNYLSKTRSSNGLILKDYFLGSHFIGKILEPFLQGTIVINFYGRHTLIREHDSYVDDMFSVGKEGAVKLISQNMNFTNLVFPMTMTERGFPEDESDGVRNFFYRSDGYKLWNILGHYMQSLVYRFYISDSAVKNDIKLQQFASSLANQDQGNIPGFPGYIHTRHSLTSILTTIAFTSSVVHHVGYSEIIQIGDIMVAGTECSSSYLLLRPSPPYPTQEVDA